MTAPTYSLTPKQHLEKSYYSSVEDLAAEVVVQTAKIFHPIISSTPEVYTEQVCLDLLLLGIYARKGLKADEKPTLEHLDCILDQLQQSRDHTYQTQKLRLWQRFILEQTPSNRTLVWQLVDYATNWFAAHSSEVLGVFTAQVNGFLANFDASNRSDALFCTSSVLEYHINMVGAEILNRLWQKSFAATEQRLLVLPGCLRAAPSSCTAEKWILGFRCNYCSNGCQIRELSQLGADYCFHVAFAKHQSSLVSHVQGLSSLGQHGSLGILGVACVLSLLEGGYMLEAHMVLGQCVPLDFCGCKNHWHEDGLFARVSVKRVVEIMMRAESETNADSIAVTWPV